MPCERVLKDLFFFPKTSSSTSCSSISTIRGRRDGKVSRVSNVRRRVLRQRRATTIEWRRDLGSKRHCRRWNYGEGRVTWTLSSAATAWMISIHLSPDFRIGRIGRMKIVMSVIELWIFQRNSFFFWKIPEASHSCELSFITYSKLLSPSWLDSHVFHCLRDQSWHWHCILTFVLVWLDIHKKTVFCFFKRLSRQTVCLGLWMGHT